MSCITLKPTTNAAASSPARTTYGHARSIVPSNPPPTEPMSIAAPDTIEPRAKIVSS